MKNRSFFQTIGTNMAIGVCLSMIGCSSPSNTGNGTSPAIAVKTPVPESKNPPVNGTKLAADMTDEQILKVFGIDISKAETKTSRGPDGSTISYKVGEQTVYITRSVVSGVAVMASGPISGDWTLGGGNS